MATPVDRTALCGAKAEAEAIRSAERRYTNLMVAVMVGASDFRIFYAAAGGGRTPDRQMIKNMKNSLDIPYFSVVYFVLKWVRTQNTERSITESSRAALRGWFNSRHNTARQAIIQTASQP